MRILAILIFSALFINEGSTEYAEEEGILVLFDDDFEMALKEFKHLLVFFHMPSCSHCIKLLPEYVNAAKVLKNEQVDVRLAKCDKTIAQEIAKKFNINGIPLIQLFKNGVFDENYPGLREAEGIVEWVKRRMGPPAVPLNTIAEVNAFATKNKKEVTVVGFFKNIDSDAAKDFAKAGNILNGIAFGVTSNSEAFAHYKIISDTVVVFKQFDEFRSDLTVNLTEENIKLFVETHRMPHVADLSEATIFTIFRSPIKKKLFTFVSKSLEQYPKIRAALEAAAPPFKGKLLFAVVDVDDAKFSNHLRMVGLTIADCPAVRILDQGFSLKYKPNWTAITAENVAKFANDFLADKVKPYYKMQELPADWESKPVKVLVAKNYNQVVNDPTKHVFVELYASWCQRCVQLAPVWDELGEKYKDRTDIIIAKMNTDANEVEGLKTAGLPTIKYYAKGKSEDVNYTGENTLEGYIKFVESSISGKKEEL